MATFVLVAVFASSLIFLDAAPASAAAPGAPVITSVARANASLTVAFSAPTGASPAITNYEYSTDGGVSWSAVSPASTALSITIPGLTNCRTYSVKVRAVNADGAGAASEAWDGVPGTFTYQLDNNLMRFGSAGEASILPNGNLKQPFYKVGANWYQLTYGSNPLSYAIAVGGVGTSEWNINGTRVEGANLSRQTIDCSEFVQTNSPASGGLAIGYGTLTTSGNLVIGTQTVKVTRTFRLTQTGKYASISESVTNISSSSLTNARMWVGTSDDYVNGNDRPNKTKGNISNGTFTALTNSALQSRALQVASGSDIVYFYTTSNLGYTSWNSCCQFSNAMNQNPLAQNVSSGSADGSYAMYLRFQDIAPGASESFNWYYIATTASDAATVLSAVSNIALPAAPTVSSVASGNSQATINFTAGSSGGSSLTNYQYSTDGGATWQTRSPASVASPLAISGLTNGQSYNVQIRAVNSEGPGTATSSTSVTPIGTPQAPQVTGLSQTATDITVFFNPPGSDGGAAVTNYEYTSDGGATWTPVSPTSTSSPLLIPGLTKGTAYSVAIRAVNSQGAGASSADQSVVTLDSPDAPTLGTPVSRNSSLSVPVTFGATGGSPITNLEYSIDGGASWVTPSPATTYTPLLITGLSNGIAYDVAVRAVNVVGHSSASNIVTGTPLTVPDSVTLPLTTNVIPSSQTLTVSFTAPDSGGSPITGYEFSTDRGATWQARTDSGGTSTTLVINALSSDGVTALTNGTEYCLQVRAINAVGPGQASNDVCSTPRTVPDAVSSLVATSRDSGVDLSFVLGSNGGEPITDVEYCLAFCGMTANWHAVGSAASPFRVDGLTNGVAYAVSVRVVNSVGASAGVTSLSVTPANNPTAPGSLTVVSGAGQATLSFVAPSSDGGIAISNYEYSTDGGNTWITRSPASTSGTIVVTGLTNGTNYGFAVRAVTASTTGQSSSVAYATPSTTPGTPGSSVFAGLSGRIAISFTAPNDGGAPITTYKYALSTNGGSSYLAEVDANTTSSSFVISGLTNGQSYFVRVRAFNINGGGSYAVTSSAITPAGVPESPVITSINNSATLVSLTDRQLAVNFTEPANNGSAITNYQYSTDNGATWRNRTDATGRFSPLLISKLSSDGTTDLSASTTYQVLIRAVNGNGSGAGSQVTSAATGGFVDTVIPTATLVRPAGASSASRVLSYNLDFSETISGLDTSDLAFATNTASCSVTSVSAASGTSFTVTVTCLTDGTVALRLNANSVTDGTNLGPAAVVTASTVTIDTVPQVTLSIASTSSASRILTYTADFSMSVSGISVADFTKASGTATCSATSVSASSGTSVTFTVTCTTDGTIVMRLLANSVSGTYSTGPIAAVTANTVTINSVTPTAQIGVSSATSNSRTLTYIVTFNAVVSGISASDFVQTSGTASCSTTNASATSGASVTFTVLCATDGTVTMRLLANSVTNGFSTGPASAINAATVTVDSVTPTATVTSPGLRSSSRTLTYVATFSESVSGISATDFIQVAGSASCVTTAVSASSGTTATFTVTCSNDGSVQMELLANSVTDGVNLAPANAIVTGSTIVDQTPPTATMASPLSRVKVRTLSYTVTFSESVIGISTSNLVQDSGTATCVTSAVSQSTGTSATFSVDCSSDGTVVMKFLADSISDGTFTGPQTDLLSREVTIDTVAPTVIGTISGPSATSKTRILTFIVNFSESVSGIAPADFVKDSGTAVCATSGVNQASGTSAVFTVSCITDGTVVMRLKANSVTDGLSVGPVVSVLTSQTTINSFVPVPVSPVPAPSVAADAPRVPTLLNSELPHVNASLQPIIITPQGITTATVTQLPSGAEQITLASNTTVTVGSSSRAAGKPAVSGQSSIQVVHGESITVSLSGLNPGSEVEVWLFSTPKFLGYVTVDAHGEANGSFEISSSIPAGAHTAQINAVEKSGSKVSVNTAVKVIDSASTSSIGVLPVIYLVGGLSAACLALIWAILAVRRRKQSRG